MKNIYLVRTKERNSYGYVCNLCQNYSYIIHDNNNTINVCNLRYDNNLKVVQINYKDFIHIKYNNYELDKKNTIYLCNPDKYDFDNKDELKKFINNILFFIDNNNIFCYSNFNNLDTIIRIYYTNKINYSKIISNLTFDTNFDEFIEFVSENKMGFDKTYIKMYNFSFYLFYLLYLKKDKHIVWS